MDKNISILSQKYPDIILKMITINDIEKLREWKNKYRDSFFYKNIISAEEQFNWFANFRYRQNDFMFIILNKEIRVGCIGFRIIDGLIDIYNVIIGESQYASKGIMKISIELLLNYIMQSYNYDITAKVLKSNKAITWYQKNGFEVEKSYDEYYLIKFQKSSLFCKTELITTIGEA